MVIESSTKPLPRVSTYPRELEAYPPLSQQRYPTPAQVPTGHGSYANLNEICTLTGRSVDRNGATCTRFTDRF